MLSPPVPALALLRKAPMYVSLSCACLVALDHGLSGKVFPESFAWLQLLARKAKLLQGGTAQFPELLWRSHGQGLELDDI